ncbi:MAG: hypothetical protein Q4B60_09165 [Erysipelotrichaceae bacterium]|nr:hypothetical protein [Erysipelotrichaceae bacterium]
MFGRKKYRKDLPAINITKKEVKGIFGQKKLVPRSKKEQRELKRKLMEQYPDRYFIDDLREANSIDPLDWIDRIEAINALFFD